MKFINLHKSEMDSESVICINPGQNVDLSIFPDISALSQIVDDINNPLNSTVNLLEDFNRDSSNLLKTEPTSSIISQPEPGEMRYWILAAFILILLRLIVERHIFKPIGRYFGIKSRGKSTPEKIPCRQPSAIPMLEAIYKSYKTKLSDSQILNLSRHLSLEIREIERWLRQRRALDKTSKLTKFTESGWRFVCYVLSTLIGVWALRDKNWIWDFNELWTDFPNHIVPIELRLYYLYGSGLYLSLLITQAFDVRRKDFWEMFVHHIVTISLLVSSWTLNCIRIGSMVMLLHDCADVFLELAKMANYVKNERLSTSTFVLFTIVWIVTRLYIYPKKIIWDNALVIVRVVPVYLGYPMVCMLVVLFGLHLFWTYFICKIALAVVNPGTEKGTRDARSSTEESSSSDVDEISNKAPQRSQQRPRVLQRRYSSAFLAKIDSSQRKIMKRISAEIM